MKLSEAIREGAKVTKYGKYEFFFEEGGKKFACAVGAAFVGLKGIDEAWKHGGAYIYMTLKTNFPELICSVPVALEKIHTQCSTLYSWILSASDSGMPREIIADLLASQGM